MASSIELFEDRAEIVTARGQRYVIDLEDVEKVSGRSWNRHNKGYAITNVRTADGRGTTLRLHRLLLDAPKDLQVDHIDGNPTNNRRANLRLCTHADNQKNRRKNINNTSGSKGVHWHKRDKRWQAKIQINRKFKHLGYFNTVEQAKAAYDAAAERLFGEFRRASEHE